MPTMDLGVLILLVFAILFCESVSGGRTNRPKCYFGDVVNRIEGGWPGMLQPECESRGMCWDTSGIPGIRWCFKPKRTDRWDCDYDNPQKRVEGGWAGISKEVCEGLGNCFDYSIPNTKWCLKPKTRPFQSILQSPRINTWGEWGEWEFCPDNSFVGSVELKIEHYQGSAANQDDTALNAIKLYCKPFEKLSDFVKTISSSEGPRGSWRGLQHFRNPAVAFQLRSEKPVGCLDDTTANDFKLISSGGENYESGVSWWGDWTKEQRCPLGTAICGIRTQIENDPKGRAEGTTCSTPDNTALNNVDIACCQLPSPAVTCRAKFSWITVHGCSDSRHCTTAITSGLKIDAMKIPINSWTKDEYEKMGFGIENVSNVLKLKFESTALLNKLRVSDIFRETSWMDRTVDIDDPHCHTAIEVVEMECGIYTFRSVEYRCRPSDDL